MELTKKTTILFSPDLHRRLTKLAAQKGISLGHLIRSACEEQYGTATREERIAAVRALASLSLPSGSPKRMKAESVPNPGELLK